MTASLPTFKAQKIRNLVSSLQPQPCRKNREKIIGILLWATSLVHHARFLLTSLYRGPFGIPAANYSVCPTLWEHVLDFLNDDAIISRRNGLHLPVGAKVTEFRHSSVTSKMQFPNDAPIEKHVWVRIRDPNTDTRKLSKESKATVLWILDSLLSLLSTIPVNRFCHLNIQAAADAFTADDAKGIGGWVTIQSSTFWFSETWANHIVGSSGSTLHHTHRSPKNVNHAQDKSTSNQDRTTPVQKLTSIMASPLLKFYQ